jgi:phage major head subunit gpT-like protein
MSVDQQVSVLTAALKTNFEQAMVQVAEPIKYEKYTTKLPSTTKIENHGLFTLVPGFSQWAGYRNYGLIDSFIYSVQNFVYHSEFMATLDDVDDEQTGALLRKPAQLVEKGKIFPSRQVLKALGNATTTPCFDGTNVVAASHTYGSGNNLLPMFNSASADGKSLNLYALYCRKELKPLIWQTRQDVEFRTNSGTPNMYESRQARWWADLRGAAAFGFWFDIVKQPINGTPNITEMHTIFQAMEAVFRSFTLPKTATSDDGEYIFEQVEFSAENLMMAGSIGLATLLRQALNQEWVPQAGVGALGGAAGGVAGTTNTFKGFADYVVSNYL